MFESQLEENSKQIVSAFSAFSCTSNAPALASLIDVYFTMILHCGADMQWVSTLRYMPTKCLAVLKQIEQEIPVLSDEWKTQYFASALQLYCQLLVSYFKRISNPQAADMKNVFLLFARILEDVRDKISEFSLTESYCGVLDIVGVLFAYHCENSHLNWDERGPDAASETFDNVQVSVLVRNIAESTFNARQWLRLMKAARFDVSGRFDSSNYDGKVTLVGMNDLVKVMTECQKKFKL